MPGVFRLVGCVGGVCGGGCWVFGLCVLFRFWFGGWWGGLMLRGGFLVFVLCWDLRIV